MSTTSGSDRWRLMSALYHEALLRPPAGRDAFLDEACEGDVPLRAEVASLLRHADLTGVMDREAAPHGVPMLEAGHDLGGYQVEGLIGTGGMGVVYRARDPKFDRPVAIKILLDARSHGDARTRFLREARTASSLNHPHIVTVHDAGDVDGRLYLVTEFVDGGTLRAWSRSGERTWQDLLELMVGIADAMATAHEAGIVHRDVKPENILVSKRGHAKLGDFGLAKVLRQTDIEPDDAIGGSAIGSVVGTPGYMAPEQAAGAVVDRRSDVFSFGVVLYEMLAGRRPFAAASRQEELQRLIHGVADPLPDSVPATLRTVVEKMLEKSPDARYQSMADVAAALRMCLQPGASRSMTPVVKEPRPRTRALRVATVVLVATLAIGGLVAWTVGGGANTVPPIQSIAVLPVQNATGDPRQDYVSDGLTEALISGLAQVHALDVTARSSAIRFKDATQSAADIARQLAVDALVRSSVRRDGTIVRLNAEIIRSAGQVAVWRGDFTGSADNLPALVADVTRSNRRTDRCGGDCGRTETPRFRYRRSRAMPSTPSW